MPRIICVGDIHGCPNTLEALLTQEIRLQKNDTLIFIGDYIDRGHDSKGVIDILLDLYTRHYDVSCLLGNHEEMFMDSSQDHDIYEHWVGTCGGAETLKSFNTSSYDELNEGYRYFFKTLLHYKKVNQKYIIVHAGLNFNNANIFSDKYAMLWARHTKIDYSILADRWIIHGHTPQSLQTTRAQLRMLPEHKIINIDTGCVFHQSADLGYLTAIDLPSRKLYSARYSE